jgi:hypothetical protein
LGRGDGSSTGPASKRCQERSKRCASASNPQTWNLRLAAAPQVSEWRGPLLARPRSQREFQRPGTLHAQQCAGTFPAVRGSTLAASRRRLPAASESAAGWTTDPCCRTTHATCAVLLRCSWSREALSLVPGFRVRLTEDSALLREEAADAGDGLPELKNDANRSILSAVHPRRGGAMRCAECGGRAVGTCPRCEGLFCAVHGSEWAGRKLCASCFRRYEMISYIAVLCIFCVIGVAIVLVTAANAP